MGESAQTWGLETLLEDTGLIRFDKKSRDGFAKLGLATIGDALTHYPRRHEDRTHFDRFPDGAMERPVCLYVVVSDCRVLFGRGKGRRCFEAVVEPRAGDVFGNRIVLRWFGAAYLQKILAVGHELVVFGLPKESGRRVVIDHPDFEIVESGQSGSEAHMGRIVPIYPLSSGVNQRTLRGLIYDLLGAIPDEALPDWLPPGDYGGLSRAAATRCFHYPATLADLVPAKRYLALEEFTRLQLTLRERRAACRARGGVPHCGPGKLLDQLLGRLPFVPTRAQLRTIEEIRSDLLASQPMSRLLQGDVGAGKTLVAAAAILLTVEAGYDAALMAPTQILAEQHFRTFCDWLGPLGVDVRLLTGTREESTAMPLFSAAAGQGNGPGSLTIGTHALIHGRAGFENGLGLAVIDEQHKFGVTQREALIGQGEGTDVLVMTATPIPRTLTLAFYGDLDVSLLDELPEGRGKIITGIRLTTQTESAAAFVRDQLAAGRQAYLVYPLIDESDKLDIGAATIEFEAWKKRLPGHEIELLHGRMSAAEKDAAMERFRSGSARVLVSTTVIEVGVDVPNANVMLIYHAERFGLAQLHQLRGRIGRGEHKSFCVLMIPPEERGARERLRILEETRDGFRIADEDLRLRGPGEVLGTVQSGLPDLKFAEFLGDTHLVEEASKLAAEMHCRCEPG